MPPKHSEAKPGEKLLALYTLLLLRGNRAISLTDLARTLDCSKQTVGRLLNQMEASGYGKLEDVIKKGRENYYRLRRPPELQVNISVEGLTQLALCRNLLLHILPKSAHGLLDKTLRDASAYAPEAPGADAVSVGQSYVKGRIDYTPFQPFLENFIKAMRQRGVCAVAYQKRPNRPPRSFAFAPMRFIAYHETLSFLGWEVTDKGRVEAKYDQPMSLYLQRCQEVKLTQRSAERLPIPEAAQPEDGRGLFGVIPGEPFGVRARFAPEAAMYVYDRQWSSRQHMEIRDDGALILDFDAQSETEVISWLLSFGDKAAALEPGWLREAIRAQAEAVAAGYRAAAEAV
jgi:predicted DNA-binding transcriptional regulator YafY